MIVVKAECGACRGTGIFRGFAEPEGIGVVCLDCHGTGCKELKYIPFTSRKARNDVKFVRLSPCGPAGETISYKEFLNGMLPKEGKK
jgi:hypothetical protein